MKDGTVLENRTSYLKSADSAGTMQFAAMGEAKVVHKFRALSGDMLSTPQQDLLIAAVLGLPAADNARELWNAFAA